MKKLIILVITVISSLTIGTKIINVNASETAVEFNKTGLGYTLNAVKNSYIDVSEIRTGSPIFNETWLDNKISNLTPDIISTSDVKSFSSTSYKDISVKIGASLGLSSSVAGSYSIFNTNASKGFDVRANFSYNNYGSQYYFSLIADFDRYAYTLPNYSSNLTDYRNNLHTDYINAITQLFTTNTQAAANSFFDTYGTHLIAKGIYGGRAEIYYSAVSNKIYFEGDLANTITNKLHSGVSNLVESKQNFSFNLTTSVQKDSSYYKEAFRAIIKGGNPFSATSITSLNNNYANWTNTIDSSPTLTRTSSDGMVPLWNLLPSSYNTTTYINKLKTWYNNYANTYNASLLNSHDFSSSISSPYTNGSYRLVRAAEKTIDDSGRFNHNVHDVIDLKTFESDVSTGYTYDILRTLGFKNVTVKIKLDMKEVDNGYQYICIYDSVCEGMTDTEKDSHKVLPDIEYSYGGSDKKTTYSTVYFTFENIPIEKFLSEHIIVLRYGAGGKNEDDWCNKNVYVQLIYSR